ncbi:hypothetical protein ACFL60_05630, partial [Candidatus Omnitrophota bacterium]
METKVKRNNRRNFPVIFIVAVILMMVLSSNGWAQIIRRARYYYYNSETGGHGDEFDPYTERITLDLGSIYEGESNTVKFFLHETTPSGSDELIIFSAKNIPMDEYEFWSLNPSYPDNSNINVNNPLIFVVTLNLEDVEPGTFTSDTELNTSIKINTNDGKEQPADGAMIYATGTVKAIPPPPP